MAATSRDTVTINILITAREAAQRFPDNKVLVRTFLDNFMQSPAKSGLPLHPKYGQKKYMVLLQQAANNLIETIYIDLNDVEEFCNKEMLDPAHLDQGVPKMQLQKDLERFVEDIETNTSRYWNYFMEACDEKLPDRDEDANMDSAALRQDERRRWREERAMAQSKTNANARSLVPIQARVNFSVRFMPRLKSPSLKMREIAANYVGGLVKLDCIVVRVGEVKPRVELVHYKCEICQADMFLTVDGERYTPPKECPSAQCQQNKQAGKLNCYIRNCIFAKHQEMRVQEMSDHVPTGGVPRGINVILSGDLTRKVLPGDAITVTGVYTPYELAWAQRMHKGTMQDMYIDAHSIKKHKNGYNEQAAAQDATELERRIDDAYAGGEEKLYERASRSIAPEIFGHGDVKKALLLALVGSVTKQAKDGMRIRGDIHTLLMGDPGVAKSQLLKQAEKIAPRSVYTTGKGSSGVGLTAAVVRDNRTGEVTLEGGALVLADTGICCIDEFDKMDENDRTAIHEVMEQQTVSIAKSGITTSLNCRTTILAAANPHYGRYNPYRSPVENINLPASLISRFDLLFLLLDLVDNEKDKQLAVHVAKVHSNYQQDATPALADGKPEGQPEDADILSLGFTPFDGNFMRAYIRKARSFEPLIEDSLKEDMVNAYVSMRDDEKRGDMDSRKSYTTPRTLQAMMRLSQAHARARFSKVVQRKDFDEAMRLMKASKESVELSAPASKGANPLDLVYDIISDLAKNAAENDGWVNMTHVISMAANKALTEEMVTEAIENWESLNVIGRNAEGTKVKFMMPAA